MRCCSYANIPKDLLGCYLINGLRDPQRLRKLCIRRFIFNGKHVGYGNVKSLRKHSVVITLHTRLTQI